jgi:hypothetical protein
MSPRRIIFRIPAIWESDHPEAIARRRARAQELADQALEERWRAAVRRNPKERRRLDRKRAPQ